MRNKRGFTLIELLIVISIIAIMAAIGGPAIKNYLEIRGITAAVNRLRGDLQMAKLEAIKQNRNCTLTFNVASYSNDITGKTIDLTQFRGGVTLGVDPETGNPGSGAIVFRPDAWSTGGAVYVYSQWDLGRQRRLRVAIAGGVSEHIWEPTTTTWVRP